MQKNHQVYAVPGIINIDGKSQSFGALVWACWAEWYYLIGIVQRKPRLLERATAIGSMRSSEQQTRKCYSCSSHGICRRGILLDCASKARMRSRQSRASTGNVSNSRRWSQTLATIVAGITMYGNYYVFKRQVWSFFMAFISDGSCQCREQCEAHEKPSGRPVSRRLHMECPRYERCSRAK